MDQILSQLGLDALYFGALSGRRGEEAGGGEFGGGFGVGTESEGGFGEAEAEGEELGVRAGEGPEKIGGRLGLAPFQEDEGKGIGARIVKAALEDTRNQGFRIVPACSFVVAYVRRHPEFDDSNR